jgi:undecaprenyl-diphosphatase
MQDENTINKIVVTRDTKRNSIRLVIVLVLFLAAIGVFLLIADEMVLENENSLDFFVFKKLAGITNSTTTSWMTAITFFGSSYFLFPAYLLIILFSLLWKRNRELSFDIATVAVTGTLILISLKSIFHRHRPIDPLVQNVNGFSFPSGHSFSSFTFFGLLIYSLWHIEMNASVRWLLTIFCFLFAVAVAFSRVYLHVHYASDVIAGFCLCMFWLTICFWTINKFKRVKILLK